MNSIDDKCQEPKAIRILKNLDIYDLVIDSFGPEPGGLELNRYTLWPLIYDAALLRMINKINEWLDSQNQRMIGIEQRIIKIEENLNEEQNKWVVLATDNNNIFFGDRTGRVARLRIEDAESLVSTGNYRGRFRIDKSAVQLIKDGAVQGNIPVSLLAALTSGEISIRKKESITS